MSEEMIIQHCAPTLAGMKTGNLFTCPYQAKKELQKEIRHLNRLLASRGIRVLPIKYYEQKVLIYGKQKTLFGDPLYFPACKQRSLGTHSQRAAGR